jgi:hypothetical protein
MAKSTKPRSTAPRADAPRVDTASRTTGARKSAATDTTTLEAATLETTHPLTLSHDVIAMRAYELYLGDGAPDGRALEHWLRAESELRERASRN